MKTKTFSRMLCIVLSAATVLGMIGIVPLSALAEYIAPTNLPAMYITLDNGVEQSAINKDDYLPATYSLVGSEDYDSIIEQPLEIKGRGNNTWTREKKPYNIKLGSKVNLLGMGKSKKWCLLANYLDKSLMRNYATLELARLMGMEETPDCRFIDLYVNGEYYGNFLITEKVEVGSTRVDINTDNGSQLFEIEKAFRHTDTGCDYCHETPSGVHIMYKDPEAGDFDTTDEFFAKKSVCDPIIDAAEASMSQGYEAYSQKIDVESFINWYLIGEFGKNYDSAFFTSDFFWYDATDGKLHMGPVWDYDTSYGNHLDPECPIPTGLFVNQAPWYAALLQDEDFLRMLKERWTQLRNQGAFTTVFNQLANEESKHIEASRLLDEARWPNAMTLTELRGSDSCFTFGAEMKYTENWINTRVKWLDTLWNINNYALTSKCNVTNLIDTSSLTGNEGINNHPIGDLFDGKTKTKYCAPNDADGTFTFSWKMLSPTPVTTYAFATANDSNNAVRTPVSWKLYGSVDGAEWFICDEQSNVAVPSAAFTYSQFVCKSSRAYSFYKVVVSEYANGGDGLFQLSEMMLGNAREKQINSAKNFAQSLGGLETVSLSDESIINNAVTAWSALTEDEVKYLSFSGITEESVDNANDKLSALLATIVRGDVNFDEAINAADALMVLQFSVYINTPRDEFQFRRSDYDQNEILDVGDALLILQYSTGIID